ncbi:type IV pilus assembly protein PilC [Flavobacterium sp. 90]|uniref:type II secretion system F family protein n=1 Tax=unclassified Flavobacterium TaxID=196869 RepID=UPI000EAF98CB|nr:MULTISPECIES: type II secretion system F family protein [unclassified Flavobacterium]RKR09076.1 type IV pilus assembly protein PilC [Flavobacterium sp. 81]TCK52860.1 type IV pilus assembly protein PilC [Flavobacterium sp. 90]
MSFDLTAYNAPKGEKKDSRIETKSFKFSKKLSDKKKEIFYRELGMLLRSGVDFKKALEILSNQAANKFERELILVIKEKVIEGRSIYESMRETNQFSAYEYYSIQIGEETRKLEEVLGELQKYFNRKIQMKRQIISVMTYPTIVMLVTFLVLYFMLNKVVPMFSSVFRQFGSELPKSTQIILKISNHSGMIFSATIGVIIGLILIHSLLKQKDSYRSFTTKVLLKIPYFGNLIRKIYISRFCQAMNLLITSKTTLINSLSLTAKMIGFYPIEIAIEQIKEDIIRGASLHESLKKHDVFENKMVSMVEVAEQVNQLEAMFERLTEQYNEEISHQTKMIGVILEPMIIIIIGAIVGVIMVSMYAPMFDLSKIINK